MKRSVPLVLPTVRALKRLDPQADEACALVQGYWNARDGGGGEFVWDALSDEPEDGGTIFKVEGAELGRWKRRLEGQKDLCLLNLAWFGATGACTPADRLAIENATRTAARLAAHRATALFFPCGTYAREEPRQPVRLRVV